MSICEGEIVILVVIVGGGSDGYMFIWDNGLGNGQMYDVSFDMSIIYFVMVIDVFGCVD